ncbi:MAG: hypothetical protein Q4B42_06115 [Oscillospiraceae bacterium]|nr:hypothetical protein [Oscillospiraceae bacterium]
MKNENSLKSRALPAAILALAPLLGVLLYCTLDGTALWEIYTPATQWNDELIYYKLTENAAAYGVPRGWFGYNESRGQLLSFGAWSPITIIHYLAYGSVLGWSLSSPLICNIALMSLSFLCFALLVRPSAAQAGLTALLYCCFGPFSRFTLSVMSECYFYALTVLFVGFAVYAWNGENSKKASAATALMILCAALLTAGRPNYAVFFLLTFYIIYKKRGVLRALGFSLGAAALALGFYWFCARYLCAAYTEPMIHLEFLELFSTGFFTGLYETLYLLWLDFKEFFSLALQGLLKPGPDNSLLTGYAALGLALAAVWLSSLVKKRKNGMLLFLAALAYASVMLALMLFLVITVASRHILPFMLAALLLLVKLEYPKGLKTAAVSAAVLMGVLATLGFLSDSYYKLPKATPQGEEKQHSVRLSMGEAMELSEGISWENTVLWVYNDVRDGINSDSDWSCLFALPEGFAINISYFYYADAEFSNLKSKYIFTCPHSSLGEKCISEGGRLLYRDEYYELLLNPKYA